jgi:hypothetical protein
MNYVCLRVWEISSVHSRRMASYKEGQGGRPIHGTVAGILTPWWTTIETNRVGVIAIIFVPSVYNRSSSIALPLDLDYTIHHEFRIYRLHYMLSFRFIISSSIRISACPSRSF